MTAQRDPLTHGIIGCAIEVHKHLGPGLLESSYETCLIHELRGRGLLVERQLSIPVRYKDIVLEAGYRLDLLVEGRVIVEIKSVESLLPIHEAQLLTYLRFANKHIGLIFNFNVLSLRQGLKRLIL
jgi:GxxExxY protein